MTTALIENTPIEAVYALYASQQGYDKAPPDVITFLDDPYYLGNIYGRYERDPFTQDYIQDEFGVLVRRQQALWDVWRQHAIQLFPDPFFSPFTEIILTGAIGTGKTTFAVVGIAYDLCKMLHLSQPQYKYGLIESTILTFALFSLNLDTAEDVTWSQLQYILLESPFFQHHMGLAKKQYKGHKGKRPLLPKSIDIQIGSRAGHGIGRAIFAALIDESNFGGFVTDQVMINYLALRRRMKSRFMKKGNPVPGHLWLMSSRNTEADFLDMRVDAAGNDPQTYVVDMSIWEAKPEEHTDEVFLVFKGNENTDPFIVEDEGQLALLDAADILEVPIEYYNEFVEDIHQALKEIAGRSTRGQSKLIRKVEALTKSLVIEPITTVEVIRIPVMGDEEIVDFVNLSLLITMIKSMEGSYCIHCDFAKTTDRAALAASVGVGAKKVSRFNASKGSYEEAAGSLISTPFCLFLEALKGDQIPLYKIFNFVVKLRDLGMTISCISADGYQSVDFLQRCMKAGFKTEELSLDKHKHAYQGIAQSIVEERWRGPKSAILKKEFKELRDVGKKFDHPPKGSKDGSDACAGSTYMCSKLNLLPDNTADDLTKQMEEALKNETSPSLFERKGWRRGFR